MTEHPQLPDFPEELRNNPYLAMSLEEFKTKCFDNEGLGNNRRVVLFCNACRENGVKTLAQILTLEITPRLNGLRTPHDMLMNVGSGCVQLLKSALSEHFNLRPGMIPSAYFDLLGDEESIWKIAGKPVDASTAELIASGSSVMTFDISRDFAAALAQKETRRERLKEAFNTIAKQIDETLAAKIIQSLYKNIDIPRAEPESLIVVEGVNVDTNTNTLGVIFTQNPLVSVAIAQNHISEEDIRAPLEDTVRTFEQSFEEAIERHVFPG